MRVRSVAVALVLIAAEGRSARPEAVVEATPGLAAEDRANLERNLRWILARERATRSEKATVGVYADAGAWHPSARGLVGALEGVGVPCRVLDRELLTTEGFAGLKALVFPGGWAPFQRDALGARGQAALKDFVEGGGRFLGVCAGAYLVSREVRWARESLAYPLGLFDGTAEGPIEGLAIWPAAGPARVNTTDAGRKRGLAKLEGATFYYQGGPRFTGGTGAEVLATWADGTAALIARRVGKGELLLTGLHLERPPPADGGDDAPAPKDAGPLLKALLVPAH